MPTPLQLNDEEMAVLMDLARPLDQQLRPQFLQDVAVELEAARQAGQIGKGSVHRVGRTIQLFRFAGSSASRNTGHDPAPRSNEL